MFKSCSKCGKIHDINYTCNVSTRPNKESVANDFRKKAVWHKKSEEIRDRDYNLCRVCLYDLYNTQHQYNYNKLSVHHIIPLEEDITKALDDDNLITLCSYHHKLAEIGIIPRVILRELTKKVPDMDFINKTINKNSTPLTL